MMMKMQKAKLDNLLIKIPENKLLLESSNITDIFQAEYGMEEIGEKSQLSLSVVNDENIDLGAKVRHLSIKAKKEKKSDRSKKSKKSQKSTSNTNKKSARKKSLRDSQLYSSNIVIVYNDEEEDEDSSTDPIEKEVEKLKKLMSKSRAKKKKRTSKSCKSNQTK